jgi:hypothetical protein
LNISWASSELALLWAVEHESDDLVTTLIQALHAGFAHTQAWLDAALSRATRSRKFKVIKLLVNAGARTNLEDIHAVTQM